MFILLTAVIAGLAAGYLRGGSLRNLDQLSLRVPWLVLGALGLQLVAFSRVGAALGDQAVVALHLTSYAVLVVFFLFNIRRVAVAIAGAGMLLNLLVISLNGGYMPASRAALDFAGSAYAGATHNNSELIHAGTRLPFLADVFAVPAWLPVSNVFSVGDVLIVAGVAALIAASMRAPARQVASSP